MDLIMVSLASYMSPHKNCSPCAVTQMHPNMHPLSRSPPALPILASVLTTTANRWLLRTVNGKRRKSQLKSSPTFRDPCCVILVSRLPLGWNSGSPSSSFCLSAGFVTCRIISVNGFSCMHSTFRSHKRYNLQDFSFVLDLSLIIILLVDLGTSDGPVHVQQQPIVSFYCGWGHHIWPVVFARTVCRPCPSVVGSADSSRSFLHYDLTCHLCTWLLFRTSFLFFCCNLVHHS